MTRPKAMDKLNILTLRARGYLAHHPSWIQWLFIESRWDVYYRNDPMKYVDKEWVDFARLYTPRKSLPAVRRDCIFVRRVNRRMHTA